MSDEPLVLGIETSCDETGVGIVRGQTLLVDTVASSVEEHARFGGVVPEVASRAHLEAMVPTIERACREAGVQLRDLDAISVTSGPGLAGALLVGVASAKALALALGKPIYGVNHLASHVAVDIVEHGPLPEPTMAMLVSGGHSSLLLVPDVTNDVRSLGATMDDAAGEAFDKVARVLGLPFPGGPHVDRAAREGNRIAIDFPRGLTTGRDMERHRFDFSFSGLKTAVARWVETRQRAGESVPVADVAASFQEAVVDVLTRKALLACKEHDVDHLLIGGGVAANSRLRALAEERCAKAGVTLRVPRPGLCTDNGAMVAALGAQMVAKGREPSDLGLPRIRRCRSLSFRLRRFQARVAASSGAHPSARRGASAAVCLYVAFQRHLAASDAARTAHAPSFSTGARLSSWLLVTGQDVARIHPWSAPHAWRGWGSVGLVTVRCRASERNRSRSVRGSGRGPFSA